MPPFEGAVVLVFLLCLFSFPGRACAQPKSEVASRILNAYGGLAAIHKFDLQGLRIAAKIVSCSGISRATNQFDCEIASKGDKFRVERSYFGQPNVFAFDGQEAWSRSGDWVSRSSTVTLDRYKDELNTGLSALKYFGQTDAVVRDTASKIVNGKDCPGVILERPGVVPVKFFADPSTFLVVRSEFEGQDGEQSVAAPQAIEYADYKRVDGFPVPFMHRRFSGDSKVSEMKVESAKIDDALSDAEFTMPPESFLARLERSPVTVPFEYSRSFILVEARVNNSVDGTFLVDTGASQSVIDKKTARAIGPYTSSTVSVTTGARAVPLAFGKVERFGIGDLVIDNVSCGICDLGPLSANLGRKISGLIGANILRRFAMTVDFENRKLVLLDPRTVSGAERGDWISVPVQPAFNESGLVVQGVLDDRERVNFLVDTGANFNKLPAGILHNLKALPSPPLGEMTGLDGHPVSFGAVRLNKLAIGSLIMSDPVFGVPGTKSGEEGLFSSRTLGILGNPVWSRFKVTFDYRGDRLIVELPPHYKEMQSFTGQIEAADRELLKSGNLERAKRSYESLGKEAGKAGLKDGQALVLSRLGSVTAEKFSRTRELKFQEEARSYFEKANKIAIESRNRQVEGQNLGAWAMFCLTWPRNSTDLDYGKDLIERALRRCPPDPEMFGSLAASLVRRDQAGQAADFVNRALLLDPANWQALWARLELCERRGARSEVLSCLEQLERYYPDFPKVKEARARSGAGKKVVGKTALSGKRR